MEHVEPLAYRPETAAKKLDIGRTLLYGLISSGELETVKIGRTRLIPASALVAYLRRLMTDQNPDSPRAGALDMGDRPSVVPPISRPSGN